MFFSSKLVAMLMLFITFLLIFSIANGIEEVNWNEEDKEISIHAPFKNCGPTYCKENCQMLSGYDRIYHHKTHFGIIVKSGIDITIMLSANVDDLMFFCLSQSRNGKYKAVQLKDKESVSIQTNFDCVPMISDSYNTNVTVTIKTKSWIELPTFKSNDVTSKEMESAFYNDVKLYGFVENTYTQMLLSAKDISILKKENCSLNDGLLNQKKVLKYYDSLSGVDSLGVSCNLETNSSEEHTILFLMNVHLKRKCRPGHSNELIRIGNVTNWLQPSGKSTWMLLTAFGHYYRLDDNLIGFGQIADVWSMMFAVFFQLNNGEEIYSMTSSNSTHESVVIPYQYGILIDEWSSEEKLHFFLSLFEYGGNDRALKELHKSHAREKSTFEGKVNIIPILVKLFQEMHQINIFPYLENVIDFKSYLKPLITPDLEVVLLSVRTVMPALDFNLSSSDWSNMIEKRGFKQTSALTLFSKVEDKSIEVNLIISPFTESIALYLNNKIHIISTESFALTLPRDVYTFYIAEEPYLSDVKHHVIANNDTTITIHVKEIGENDISSPLIHSYINVKDDNGKLLLNVFINYKDMTISLLQLSNNIQTYELYIQLRRNDTDIFSYILNQEHSEIPANETFTFEMNDRLLIHHDQPENVEIDGKSLKYLKTLWRTFVFARNMFRHIAYPYYTFSGKFNITAKGLSNKVFLVIDIDYDARIMQVNQTSSYINPYFTDHYFAMKFERNGRIIYECSISNQTLKSLHNKMKFFLSNDKLHLFHEESSRLFIGGINVREVLTGQQVEKHIFLLTELGLVDADDRDRKLLKENILKLKNFNNLYNNAIRDNPLYHYYLSKYTCFLRNQKYIAEVMDVCENSHECHC